MPHFDIAALAKAGVTGPLLAGFLLLAIVALRLPKLIGAIERFVDSYRRRTQEYQLACRRMDEAQRQRLATQPAPMPGHSAAKKSKRRKK
jgi:hypothetical protein